MHHYNKIRSHNFTGLYYGKLHINITNEMAPKAKIVAYYIRDNNEAIADSIILRLFIQIIDIFK